MTDFDAGDALAVLTQIKLYHQPQDNSDAVAVAWARALSGAGVTNVQDAMQAVDRHYSTPGANPWIIPGDVIGHYRQIREARLKGISHADLTEDVDPNDTTAYLATLRHRIRCIGDGMPIDAVRALPLPAEAAHAALTPEKRTAAIEAARR